MSSSFGNAPLLRPMVGLCLWTFTMEAWMYAKRIPAITTYNVKFTRDSPYNEIKTKLPRPVEWPAENFTHLHEQPTLFYAVCLALTQIGVHDDLTLKLAWTYVGLRVVHSIVQASINKVNLRFYLFALSGLNLLGLTGKLAANVL